MVEMISENIIGYVCIGFGSVVSMIFGFAYYSYTNKVKNFNKK